MSVLRISPRGLLLPHRAGAVIYSQLGPMGLRGEAAANFVARLSQLLDGTRTIDDIRSEFGAELQQNIDDLLYMLDRQDLLEESPTAGGRKRQQDTQETFLRLYSTERDSVRNLQEMSVIVVALEPWTASAARELAAAGLGSLSIYDTQAVTVEDLEHTTTWRSADVGRLRRDAFTDLVRDASPRCRIDAFPLTELGNKPIGEQALMISGVAYDLVAEQLHVTQQAHRSKIPYLCASFNGPEAVLGPLVVPGETACWKCWRLRSVANATDPWAARIVHAILGQGTGFSRGFAGLAPAAGLLGHLIALEAIKFLTCDTLSRLAGSVLVQHLVTSEVERHRIVPMPWCETCADLHAAIRIPCSLKAFTEASSEEELRESLDGWIDSRTGVISSVTLAPHSPDHPGLPFRAYASLSAYWDQEEVERAPRIDNARENCGGKGLTAGDALRSAAGEALERYSAGRVRVKDLTRCSQLALKGVVLDPRSLVLYTEAQYQSSGFPFVRYSPDRQHLWTRGTYIDDGSPVWTPALASYYSEFTPGCEDRFMQVTSNGLAAGQSFEEAALRAVYELIERDALLITWLGRRAGRRIVTDHIDPRLNTVISQLEDLGAKLDFRYLDTGLGVPTVLCLAKGDGRRWPALTVGSAAHPDLQKALEGALLEQAYSGPVIRDIALNNNHRIPRRSERVSSFLDHALYYAPKGRGNAARFFDRSTDGPEIRLDEFEPRSLTLKALGAILRKRGIRVALVDVTSPDVRLSAFRVVRALGPGLQPLYCGHGQERIAFARLRAFGVCNHNVRPHPIS